MPIRRFVVVVLPARDTRLGRLADETGCRIQLMARRAPGPAYDIEFVASALPAEAAEGALADLSALSDVTRSSIDVEAQTWRLAARVPLSSISSGTCRALVRATLDSGRAWLVLDAGLAHLRLLPAEGVPPEALEREVTDILDPEGSAWDIYLADVDSGWYDVALQTSPVPVVA